MTNLNYDGSPYQNNINNGLKSDINNTLERNEINIQPRHVASVPSDNYKRPSNLNLKLEENISEWDRIYSANVTDQHLSNQLNSFPVSHGIDSSQASNSSIRKSGYRPYPIKETKESNKEIKSNNGLSQVGGLGPNTGGEEWLKKKEKQDKMNEFASNVKLLNMQNAQKLPPSNLRKPKIEEISKSKRDIAIEFSKKIPKPRIKKSDADGDNDIKDVGNQQDHDMGEKEDELEKYEIQHMHYLNQVEKIKIS